MGCVGLEKYKGNAAGINHNGIKPRVIRMRRPGLTHPKAQTIHKKCHGRREVINGNGYMINSTSRGLQRGVHSRNAGNVVGCVAFIVSVAQVDGFDAMGFGKERAEDEFGKLRFNTHFCGAVGI